MSGSSARIAFITSSELAVGSGQMPMNVAFCPEKRTSMSESSAPRSTSAMSFSRTIAPFCSRSTSSPNSSAVRRSVLATRLIVVIEPLVMPTAER